MENTESEGNGPESLLHFILHAEAYPLRTGQTKILD